MNNLVLSTHVLSLFSAACFFVLFFLTPKQDRYFRDPLIRWCYNHLGWFPTYGQAVLAVKLTTWGLLSLLVYIDWSLSLRYLPLFFLYFFVYIPFAVGSVNAPKE